MTSDRKKPGVAFWAAVAVVVALVLYPLSFGPWCWLTAQADRGSTFVPAIYRPVTRAAETNRKLSAAIRWYASIAAPERWTLLCDYFDEGPPRWKWHKLRRLQHRFHGMSVRAPISGF